MVVSFSATDALSGVAPGSLTLPVTFSADGTNLSASGQATDLAGNVGSVTLSSINIDQVNPTIAVTLSPPANANAFRTSAVTAHFICTDALSGIATCPADQVITTEGTNQTVSGTAVDRAGNSASVTSEPFNIDLHAPTVSGFQPAQLTIASGGGTGNLTVNIQNPDPFEDVHVAVMSGDATVVSVPGEVALPTGAATTSFTVIGGVAGGPVPITATLNGTSATVEVTVRDRPLPPALAEPLAEGSTLVGGTGVVNALVSVSVNGTAVGSGAVEVDGHFGVFVPVLGAGQVVTATQTMFGLTTGRPRRMAGRLPRIGAVWSSHWSPARFPRSPSCGCCGAVLP